MVQNGPVSGNTTELPRPNAPPEDKLAEIHEGSIRDFLNPLRFGYLRDREHVAGFQPHQFSTSPGPAGSAWELLRLDLVGLVQHNEPVAYLSDSLPRMDVLREAATRPLDEFEQQAPAALPGGEDLKVEYQGDEIRMVGALRALKQCIDCHGVQRGKLLRAFSYLLRRQ